MRAIGANQIAGDVSRATTRRERLAGRRQKKLLI
jgi:hypothetical protein